MSLSVYMALETKDKDSKWEKVSFIVPDFDGKDSAADFSFPNGCHDIFTMLDYEHSGAYDAIFANQSGMPEDVSDKVRKDYEDWCDGNSKPNVHFVNLADLHLTILARPEVIDYETAYEIDEEETESNAPMIENPLKEVYNKAITWMNVWTANLWNDFHESDVRIIGWVVR